MEASANSVYSDYLRDGIKDQEQSNISINTEPHTKIYSHFGNLDQSQIVKKLISYKIIIERV